MTDELRLYWTLHGIDEQALAHEAALARQPAVRRQHESAVAAARKAIETLDRRSADALKARRAAEGEIAAIEAMERKFDTQLTAVTNQHQFEAVQHQLAAARAKRSDFETVALEQLDVEERLAAERPALVDALAKAEREAAAGTAALDQEAARLRTEIGALDARREHTAAKLDAAGRNRYERLRAGRTGRAIAAVSKGSCGACFRGLAPHGLQVVRKQDQLLICDGCGLLLMSPPDGEGNA